MAFSYSGDPAGSKKDAVRFLISDTNSSRILLQDAEILWCITQEMNVYKAAARCCGILIAKAGAIKSKKISEFSITYSTAFYATLMADLEARGNTYQTPYAGGISIADKTAQQNDADWVPAAIPRGLDDNPEAPSPVAPSTNPLATT